MKLHLNTEDNFKLVALAVAGLIDDVVTIVSFGTINPDLRAELLFSDWMDDGD